MSLIRGLTRLVNENCKLYSVLSFAQQRGLTFLLMSAAMVDPCHLYRKTTPHYKGYNFFRSLLISPIITHIYSLTEWHFVQNMPNCAGLGSYVNATRTRLKLTDTIFWYIIWKKKSWNLWDDLLNSVVMLVSYTVSEKTDIISYVCQIYQFFNPGNVDLGRTVAFIYTTWYKQYLIVSKYTLRTFSLKLLWRQKSRLTKVIAIPKFSKRTIVNHL